MPDDFELLDRWRSGDRTAGNELFERHFGAVYRFFRNKAADAIDDLTQRTFLACAEHQSAFRQEASFRTYLFAIARNELRAHIRRLHRGVDVDPQTQSIMDLVVSMRQRLTDAEDHRRLLFGLCQLPLDYQIALELHYWEGLTVEEIARVLDVPLGTAKSRLRRGRDRLARNVADLGDDAPIPEVTLANLDRWSSEIRAKLDAESQAP
ncbi:MAG: RNA polymerase sigma factor [Nannocystaceae bacterium]|nr:sigma-70 family RNA polymerase sigma factor [bacterium]